MSGQQPNVWQTAARSRQSHSASRTPQNRSNNASPAQQSNPTQPPRQETGRQQQIQNAWTQRSSSASGTGGGSAGSNGSLTAQQQGSRGEQSYTPVNGFNGAEVKAFLGREAGVLPASYKDSNGGAAGKAAAGSGGAAYSAKPNAMAKGQPFFLQLAKAIATSEGGG
ncbi:hypothetical protein B0A50_01510 [Salinomyces thailandicus]|uniref:Uncharacterized protein n=1 Tax=Salinomyces thailandicus TaxID=706561 RepID=A0A4U0UB06_9PEZI|nr:hypothetical protein B0A50_01510 [Salinomyces thailandica]